MVFKVFVVANFNLIVIVHKGGAVIGDSLGFVEWVPLEVQQAIWHMFRAVIKVMVQVEIKYLFLCSFVSSRGISCSEETNGGGGGMEPDVD